MSSPSSRRSSLYQALLTALLTPALLPATGHAQVFPSDDEVRQNIQNARENQERQRWLNEGAATLPTVHATGERESDIPSEQTRSYTVPRSRASTGLSLSPRETPQSVSVITHQQMTDQGAGSLTEALQYAPGISSSTYDSRGNAFRARGFDIDNLRTDGVPMAISGPWSAGESRDDTVLYDRIEVVRGATGLLTGAGDPSAAINQIRKHANSRQLTGKVGFGLGSWKERRLDADVSSALNADGSVRGRFVANIDRSDSYIDLYEKRKNTFYGVIDADLTPDTQLSVGVSRQRDKPKAGMWGGLPTWYDDGTRTDWPRSKTTAPKWSHWGSTSKTWFATLKQRVDAWDIRLDYNRIQNQADARLLWATGNPNRTTGLGITTSGASWYDIDRKQDQIDLQASRPFEVDGLHHELVLGASHSKLDFSAMSRSPTAGVQESLGDFNNWTGDYPYPTAWGDPFVSAASKTTQNALYGVARLQLSAPSHLILGSRITNYEQKEAPTRWRSTGYTIKHDRQVIPYAGLTYDVSPETTAYASYTSIFKPQTNQDKNGNYLDPIKGKSYEVGLKGSALGGHLQTDLALFRIQQDNLAVADGANLVPNTTSQAYRAAKGARSTGYEITVTGALSPVWDISAGWTQYKIKDASGTVIGTNHPRKQLKLFTTYRLGEELQGLELGGGVNWQSEIHADVDNPVTDAAEQIRQKSFALVDLMARYEIDRNWSVQANIYNVFDKKYYDSVGFYNRYTWGPSRRYLLTATYRF